METTAFNKLMLKTAFSCMACDGDIDKRELSLIKELHRKQNLFGDIEIDYELDNLLVAINHDGQQFLRQYFTELTTSNMNMTEEERLLEMAISVIKADDDVTFSEVKFFKVIRSKLNVKNEAILKKHPDFEEYLEEDIMGFSYIASMLDDFFDTHPIPIFKELEHTEKEEEQ